MNDEACLLEIARCADDSRVFDLVFVHGLDGVARETWEWEPSGPSFLQRLWQFLRRKAEAISMAPFFWPDAIAKKFPAAGVWSLGYPAASTAWRGHAMPLPDRARNVLQLFCHKKIGARPLVLIVRSLGGLLASRVRIPRKPGGKKNC